MVLKSLKQKFIITITVIGIILITFFTRGIYQDDPKKIGVTNNNTAEQTTTLIRKESPKIISIKPDNLNDSVILSSQVIEITFNKMLVNGPETKVVIDPKIKFNVELSDDKKTAKIIPLDPYKLGQGYTLIIKSEAKFEGGEILGHEESFHFRTISYQGI